MRVQAVLDEQHTGLSPHECVIWPLHQLLTVCHCHRFAGLLIVTHLLPDAQPEVLRKVYEAVGQQFFSRLLLPLTRTKASMVMVMYQPTSTYTLSVMNLASRAQYQGVYMHV